ncbi:unnamed protein product [Gongylonema pulchrum]|uniref:Protein kinase domain-containing protein n=1 Tax=Gongylonema pulchrum TaxID=637853 RepID=A0A183D7Q0_9BILA|nr:unnamed protein product [Gongylonema pulchrum]
MVESTEEELDLKEGSVIESSRAKYVIDELLGEGGFGAVYKVHDANNAELNYALKVERKLETLYSPGPANSILTQSDRFIQSILNLPHSFMSTGLDQFAYSIQFYYLTHSLKLIYATVPEKKQPLQLPTKKYHALSVTMAGISS